MSSWSMALTTVRRLPSMAVRGVRTWSLSASSACMGGMSKSTLWLYFDINVEYVYTAQAIDRLIIIFTTRTNGVG